MLSQIQLKLSALIERFQAQSKLTVSDKQIKLSKNSQLNYVFPMEVFPFQWNLFFRKFTVL